MTDAPPATMTKQEYARHRGVTPEAIYMAVKRGSLHAPALLHDGRVVVDLADAMLGPPGRYHAAPAGAPMGAPRHKRPGRTPPATSVESKPAPAASPVPDGPVMITARGTGAGQGDTGAAGESYAIARARREAAQASRAELELRTRTGDLVERAAVDRALADIFVALRDAILAVPRELAAQLASIGTEHGIETALTTALKAALDRQADAAHRRTEGRRDAA